MLLRSSAGTMMDKIDSSGFARISGVPYGVIKDTSKFTLGKQDWIAPVSLAYLTFEIEEIKLLKVSMSLKYIF